jgi:hypothetical protein
MATEQRKPWPIRRAVTVFHEQTLEQLGMTGDTQHVWPEEIYPGFRQVNEMRRRAAGGDPAKGWFSTGEGRKSIEGKIVSMNDAGDITLQYSILRYMRFVDMGVGAGTKKEDVDRQRKASWKSRYTKWNRAVGMSHRPFWRMELNHLETRLGTFLRDWYGHEFIETINGLDDNTIELIKAR